MRIPYDSPATMEGGDIPAMVGELGEVILSDLKPDPGLAAMTLVAAGCLQPPPHRRGGDAEVLGDEPDLIAAELAAVAQPEQAGYRKLANLRTCVPLPMPVCHCHAGYSRVGGGRGATSSSPTPQGTTRLVGALANIRILAIAFSWGRSHR